jgi:hypothetical protein
LTAHAPTRRALLAGAAAAALLPAPALAQRPEAGGAGLARFMRLSHALTGQDFLDPATGSLIRSFVLGDRDLAPLLPRLEAAAAERGDLARRIAAQGLEPVAEAVLEGWVIGVYGPDDDPRFVAYPDALMYRAVADFHNVPTFCGGTPGFWAAPPDDLPNPWLEG